MAKNGKRTRDNLETKKLESDVAALQADGATGTFTDGGGLYLIVTPAGRARFVHKFQWAGKTAERMFPGDFPKEIKLSKARAMRDADRALLRERINPIHALKAQAEAAKGVPTFGAYARTHAPFLAPKSDAGRKTWLRQMTAGDRATTLTVGALADMPIDDIQRVHVKAIIEPIWESNAPTALVLLSRIRAILDHRYVNTEQDEKRVNPALFEKIERAIGVAFDHKKEPRAALAWREVPAFLAKLADRPQLGARCLEMVIATGCRVSEIINARWGWIDWKARTITIPAKFIKTREQHVIPLSRMMVQTLRRAIPPGGIKSDALIFPNGRGNPYQTKEVLEHVKALAGAAPTTHGFRACLTGWGSAVPHRAHAPFAESLMDVCLAHRIGNEVSQAYLRDRWLERRRVVMREWSRFCLPPAAEVIPFRKAA